METSDGDAAPAPLPLRWVEELVKTRSVELGTDDVATPGELASWLQERGLLPPAVRVTPAAHARALQVREGLRALIAANNDGEPAGAEWNRRRRGGGRAGRPGPPGPGAPARARCDRPPRSARTRATGTVDAALATLLAAVAGAIADRSWSRMKACRDPGCRWAYFDHSRNRSRAWCSMALCGNRAKARAFRRVAQRSNPASGTRRAVEGSRFPAVKAAVFYETGGPEVFRYEDVPDPALRPGGLLVEVGAVGVQGGDLLHRQGGVLATQPHIVGYQAAGIVARSARAWRASTSASRSWRRWATARMPSW